MIRRVPGRKNCPTSCGLTEAVIPVEVGITSTRREAFNEEDNDDLLRVNLDCLDEVRDKAFSKMTEYQKKNDRLLQQKGET